MAATYVAQTIRDGEGREQRSRPSGSGSAARTLLTTPRHRAMAFYRMRATASQELLLTEPGLTEVGL